MIEVKSGANLLESTAQTLVNTVNTVGVMGKGIALEFKRRFPEMYADYVKRCERGEVRLGQPYPYYLDDGRIIINFPTKEHWRAVSRLDAIVAGLEQLERSYESWGITSIAVPLLGCGNGQLEWRVVGRTLYRHLSRLAIPVELYAPYGTPAGQLDLGFFTGDDAAHPEPEKVAPGWIALVEVIGRITSQRFHWPIGRTRLQKLAYFLAAEGVPTEIEYHRDSYGPFSSNLKSVSAKLINNGLIVERKLGRMLAVSVGPTYEDAKATYSSYLAKWDASLDRVADLFARLRTDETEVAATVHLATNDVARRVGRKPTEAEVLTEVMQWKARRKPPLERDNVASAIRNLAMLGWIDVEPSEELGDEDVLLVGV